MYFMVREEYTDFFLNEFGDLNVDIYVLCVVYILRGFHSNPEYQCLYCFGNLEFISEFFVFPILGKSIVSSI